MYERLPRNVTDAPRCDAPKSVSGRNPLSHNSRISAVSDEPGGKRLLSRCVNSGETPSVMRSESGIPCNRGGNAVGRESAQITVPQLASNATRRYELMTKTLLMSLDPLSD